MCKRLVCWLIHTEITVNKIVMKIVGLWESQGVKVTSVRTKATVIEGIKPCSSNKKTLILIMWEPRAHLPAVLR